MKNLNKKIGAIALAGMMVAGGVIASGASAYANGSLDHDYLYQYEGLDFALRANLLNEVDRINIKQLESICESENIVVLDISRDSKKIDKFIEKRLRKYASKEELDSLNRVYNVQKFDDIKVQLIGSRGVGCKYVRISYDGIQYLFELMPKK